MDIRRLYVEKKEGFNVEARNLLQDLKHLLHLEAIEALRILHRYDIEGMSEDLYKKSKHTIFSEPPSDKIQDSLEAEDGFIFSVSYLPGQYDQRADSAMQALKLISPKENPVVKYAKTYVINGNLTTEEQAQIKKYLINPVDSTLVPESLPQNLAAHFERPQPIAVIDGFINWDEKKCQRFLADWGLAMDLADLRLCQDYFKTEKRNPTETEIRVLDTYWSDHCRHTTFSTEIESVEIKEGFIKDEIQAAYRQYQDLRAELGIGKKETLMDLATIAMKKMRKDGLLEDLEISDEINACSIEIEVLDEEGQKEDWLLMFKNETHNHPTEIEPFGGAATCLGGAIRDPLSGRAYVYQAMRVTGASNPKENMNDTLKGKLPQRLISKKAADGYSAYGNQIGLATGLVSEIYHPGYQAKRMEVGAVIGACPKDFVRREKPVKGDQIILLGGRTGRDGCGGATGSSKSHDSLSIETCGAEVQKGNAPEERKIQRLFRNKEATKCIKKCNDFGAGGVSVAVGELADSLTIDLDLVPKKYEGLSGTELAISESQERMAVVVSKEEAPKFMALAQGENIETTVIATVEDHGYLRMYWGGEKIVDLKRTFLDQNGATKKTPIVVDTPFKLDYFRPKKIEKSLKEALLFSLSDLNVASQKGLIEKFDATVGAGTVLMPLGGKNQETPTPCMVAKIPVLSGDTTTVSGMSYGYDPYLSSESGFHGSIYAVIDGVAKLVSAGFSHEKIRLSFQEYFEKLGQDAHKWGKPFVSLLGALTAQMALGIPAIGGKDSMSGTFNQIHVPPTLISFGVATGQISHVISPDLKHHQSEIYWLSLKRDEKGLPDFDDLKRAYRCFHDHVKKGYILSAMNVSMGGILPTLSQMMLGNDVGVVSSLDKADGFVPFYGDLLLEVDKGQVKNLCFEDFRFFKIGHTTKEQALMVGEEKITLGEIRAHYLESFDDIFPRGKEIVQKRYENQHKRKPFPPLGLSMAKPRVFVPAFPGTNGEYDMARAFERAGAKVNIVPFRNLNPGWIEDSILAYERAIHEAQIIAIPGGFSAGDEPDGAGKFIASVFRNPRLKEALMSLLTDRKGLMLGICNGFQALIKLGLLPYGEIRDLQEDSPTLTFNHIGRHISHMGSIRLCTLNSPWLQGLNPETVYKIALSHGEGRLVAQEKWLQIWQREDQIGSIYVDAEGHFQEKTVQSPNGAVGGIESLLALEGRILGKMGHSERYAPGLYQNIPGEKIQDIFSAGVSYFK